MKTLPLFSVGVVVAGLIAVCGASRFALAQQTGQPKVRVEAQQMHIVRQGQNSIGVFQGNVKLSREDGGPLELTTTPDAFVYTAPGNSTTTARIPMDMTTLRVNVTSAGTVFMDGKGNTLTLQISAPAKQAQP